MYVESLHILVLVVNKLYGLKENHHTITETISILIQETTHLSFKPISSYLVSSLISVRLGSLDLWL